MSLPGSLPVSGFPTTHVSLVRRARSGDDETRVRARDALAEVYWAPIYAHLRLSHGIQREDAEDLTQGFFVEALRRDLFARYEPERARFRTYLRTCVDAYVSNARKAERRLKRGGGLRPVAIDVADIEERLTTGSAATDAELLFEREWVRSILGTALTRLRTQYTAAGRTRHLAVFERYDLAGAEDGARPTYGDVAAELGLTTTQVTNWLAVTRRDFRAIVLATLRDLTGSDEEFRAEARSLLGVSAP